MSDLIPVGTIVNIIKSPWKGKQGTIIGHRAGESLWEEFPYRVRLCKSELVGILAPDEIEPSGTMMPAARASIDHGRIETLRRREAFSRVHVEIRSGGIGPIYFEIPTEAMLSPRRIYRVLKKDTKVKWGYSKKNRRRARARKAIEFADAIHTLLRDYRSNGYQLDTIGTASVYSWRLRLVQN